MPYVFNYRGDSGTKFSCDLICERCAGKLKTGTRCTRTVCIGLPFCWQHLMTCKDDMHGLKIKKSPIAGKGLFAWSKEGRRDIVYKPGETITLYEGERLTQAQLTKRFGDDTAPYAIDVGGGVIDAACRRGAGAIANAPRNGGASNAEFRSGKKAGMHVVKLVAIKPIRHNEEILCDYGEIYWNYARGKHSTRRKG